VIPVWLRPLVIFFDALAWIGLALCFVSHLSALSGTLGPFAALTRFLVIGLVVVWLPTVLIAARMGVIRDSRGGIFGALLPFYSAAAAILYSATHAQDEARRCLNGHAIGPLAKFCEECGQPVVKNL
jgi:hypothetical protein